jgi:DNA-binding response OmpR family regulator
MKHRLLVAEDDPVGAQFLCDTLAPAGAVEHVANPQAWHERLHGPAPDLLILDDHLGDQRGDRLLAELRAAWGPQLPVLLISADLPASLRAKRLRQGAGACLAKPMSADQLWQALGALLPTLLPIWDDRAAARALGEDAGTREALRALLRAELPSLREQIVAAARRQDRHTLSGALHRLHAACGFCGAAALDAAACGLGEHPDPARIQAFEGACDALLTT